LDYSHKTETQNQISDVISDFIHTEDLNISKLKKMLAYADKLSKKASTRTDQHLDSLEEGHDHMLYKMIYSIIEHTFIEIESDSSGLETMKKDFFGYIKNFENNQLKNVAYKKYLTAGLVTNPENICTYEKHAEVFEELLAEQAERYGKSFVARNTFYNPVNANEFCELNIFSRYKQRDFLFFHTLFSFFKSGKFSNIWAGTDAGLNGPPSEYKCHIHLTDDYYHSLVEADMRVDSIDLDTANITYNKENNHLEIGGFLINFSNHEIAQRVCKYLFSDLENLNETHWDKVYEEVVDDLSSTQKDNKEKRVRIYDAVREINRKVNQQINTDKKLLDWDEGRIEISY
jgi:hypothetical protein